MNVWVAFCQPDFNKGRVYTVCTPWRGSATDCSNCIRQQSLSQPYFKHVTDVNPGSDFRGCSALQGPQLEALVQCESVVGWIWSGLAASIFLTSGVWCQNKDRTSTYLNARVPEYSPRTKHTEDKGRKPVSIVFRGKRWTSSQNYIEILFAWE